MKINENSIWQTADGRRIKLKDLSDIHLANIIDYIPKIYSYSGELFEFLKKMAGKRGLKKQFLARAQIPYKNEYDKWEIFDFVNKKFLEIQK